MDAINRWMKFESLLVQFVKRPYMYAVVFSLLLTAAFTFTLLDTFVIPKAMRPVSQQDTPWSLPSPEQSPTSNRGASTPGQAEDVAINDNLDPVITAASYEDENIKIVIETTRAYDTDVYIADIQLSGIDYLKSAFAQNIYGRNINEKTSVIAKEQNAIFAVNGDYYGFRNDGWVLRNGVLYRTGGSDAALLMDMEGNLSCNSDKEFIEKQAADFWQIWSFGPPLVVDDEIPVTKKQEISGRSSYSNPRTAVGQASELHYIFIVSDGRTEASAGLSLYELASLFKERGCSVAYNLDGGGSATMYFNGQIINKPTTDGRRISEREISDIVYIGY